MNQYRYYLAGIGAFFLWGFFSLVLKPLQDYASIDILFYRIFASVFFLVALALLFRRQKVRSSLQFLKTLDRARRRKFVVQIVLGGIFLTANWFFFIFVMNHISVKASSFAYLICPILTTALAAIILKERLSFIQVVAVGISVVSCAILAVGSWTDLIFSTLVAFSYALFLISQPKYREVDSVSILTVEICCAAIILTTVYPSMHGPVPREPMFYAYIATIAILFTIVPLLLNLYALQGLKSSTTGILLYVNPIVGFLLAVVYYHEKIDALQVAGYALMVVSVIVFNMPAFLSLKTKPALKERELEVSPGPGNNEL